MEHQQYLIEDMPYSEVEEIVDNNFGTKVELLETYGLERNRVSIRYNELENLSDALQLLYDNGASYSEV